MLITVAVMVVMMMTTMEFGVRDWASLSLRYEVLIEVGGCR